MSDEEIVGRIMDKAQVADRRALFAALQAAVGVIVDLRYDHNPTRDPFVRVEDAIDLGAEVGSPEHLEHIEAALFRHFDWRSDPCQDRGADWPCDVARALRPDLDPDRFPVGE